MSGGGEVRLSLGFCRLLQVCLCCCYRSRMTKLVVKTVYSSNHGKERKPPEAGKVLEGRSPNPLVWVFLARYGKTKAVSLVGG